MADSSTDVLGEGMTVECTMGRGMTAGIGDSCELCDRSFHSCSRWALFCGDCGLSCCTGWDGLGLVLVGEACFSGLRHLEDPQACLVCQICF